MSHIIASAAIRGAHKIAAQAEELLTRSVAKNGRDCTVEFPNTAYYLPIIHSMLGLTPSTLGDLEEVIDEIKKLLPPMVAASILMDRILSRGSGWGQLMT
ncbi:MAG: hypothetical protein ACYS72_02960 [Planctomycetota bacterium]|jgi:acetyl-CoA synthase